MFGPLALLSLLLSLADQPSRVSGQSPDTSGATGTVGNGLGGVVDEALQLTCPHDLPANWDLEATYPREDFETFQRLCDDSLNDPSSGNKAPNMGCYCSPVHGDVNCDEDIETMLYCAAACRCVERTNQTGPQDLGETKVKSSEAEKPATWEKMDGLYDALMRALAEDKAASSQNSDMDPKNCGSGDPNARSCPVQPPPSQPAAINFTEPQPPASPKNDASSQAEQQPPAAPAANDTQRCLGTCNSIATKCSHDATCMCGAYSTNVHLKTAIRYLGHCILRSARVRRRDIFGEDDGDGDHLYLDEGGLPLACPCNATYVSHACCNSMTGMLWEPAHRKLGELIIQS